MSLPELLRRTAHRYEQARELVMREHPGIPEGDLEQLVVEAVRRLASHNLHLQDHDSERVQEPRAPSFREPG